MLRGRTDGAALAASCLGPSTFYETFEHATTRCCSISRNVTSFPSTLLPLSSPFLPTLVATMVSYLSLLLLIFSVRSFAAPISKRGAQSFVLSGDAPFTVSTATLAAALTCPNGNPTSSSPPVLLVHGTGSTGEETWGSGYVPALLAKSYTACYVTLRKLYHLDNTYSH